MQPVFNKWLIASSQRSNQTSLLKRFWLKHYKPVYQKFHFILILTVLSTGISALTETELGQNKVDALIERAD
jgi:hypothetical protein